MDVKMSGFTMVELLVTVALVGIIAIISVANFDSYKDKAEDAAVLNDLHNIHLAVVTLENDTGLSPGGLALDPCVQVAGGNEFDADDCSAGLLCDSGVPGWSGPYLTADQAVDPWGTPYQFDPDYNCITTVTGCNFTGWARAINSAGRDQIRNNYDASETALIICRS